MRIVVAGSPTGRRSGVYTVFVQQKHQGLSQLSFPFLYPPVPLLVSSPPVETQLRFRHHIAPQVLARNRSHQAKLRNPPIQLHHLPHLPVLLLQRIQFFDGKQRTQCLFSNWSIPCFKGTTLKDQLFQRWRPFLLLSLPKECLLCLEETKVSILLQR